MTTTKMTTKATALAIVTIMKRLPKVEQDTLQRIYGKTWTIASLTQEGYVNPTEDARNRLEDLHYAVLNARTAQLDADIAANLSADNGRCPSCHKPLQDDICQNPECDS